jgi:hypothetical protein
MPYIGKSPHFGVRNRFIYTATGDETSKSGADDNGATLTFTDGAYVDVYLNGVLLKPDTDYVTTTANTIGSLSALSTSDILEVIVYDVFSVSDTVSAASGGTFQGAVEFNGGVTGNLDLNTDSAVIKFGADDDVTITHDPDDGLILKSTATADDNPFLLTLQTGETDLAANDVIGKIAFQAPDEGTGTDAILVSAAIQAVAEGDHSSSSNASSLVFMTGASEAAAEKVRIDSSGNISIGNGASTNDGAIHINAGGSAKNIVLEGDRDSDGQGIGNLQFHSAGTNVVQISGERGSTDAKGDLALYTNGGSLTERLRIHEDGYVGIGTSTNTSTRLYVKSAAAAENTLYCEGDNQDDGHTIIGYTFSAQSGNTLRIYQDSTGSDGYLSFFHTDASTSCMYINRNGGDGQIVAYAQGGTVEGSVSISGTTTSYNAFTGSHWSRLADNSKPTILRGTVVETLDEMCDWYHLAYTIPPVLWTEDDEETKTILYVEGDFLPDGKKVGDVKTAPTKKVGDERYGDKALKEPYAKPDNKNVGDKVNHDHEGKGVIYEATIEKTGDVKHVKCKISDTADCTNVYGVFMSWDDDDDSVNDMYVNAVGTSLVRIHKDQTVSKGDLLTSNGDGTAKKQDDDIIRSKTIGKVLSNVKQETYSDGSYTVPCALYCG